MTVSFRSVKYLLSELGISIVYVFLQETKCSGEELASIAQKVWKGYESVVVDARGAAGGLGILWNPHVVLLSGFLATTCTLSAEFHILGTRIRGFISNVYGPLREDQKL